MIDDLQAELVALVEAQSKLKKMKRMLLTSPSSKLQSPPQGPSWRSLVLTFLPWEVENLRERNGSGKNQERDRGNPFEADRIAQSDERSLTHGK